MTTASSIRGWPKTAWRSVGAASAPTAASATRPSSASRRSALFVVKRSGEREPFGREKILRGVRAAAKNRPVDEERPRGRRRRVEESMRLLNRDVTSEEVGMATLEALRDIDDVAYVRFASVYKGFEGTEDFAREIGMLVKTTAPKHRG